MRCDLALPWWYFICFEPPHLDIQSHSISSGWSNFFVAWHMCSCFDQSFVNHIFFIYEDQLQLLPWHHACVLSTWFPPFFRAVLAILALWKAAAPTMEISFWSCTCNDSGSGVLLKCLEGNPWPTTVKNGVVWKKWGKHLQKDHLFWEWVGVMS